MQTAFGPQAPQGVLVALVGDDCAETGVSHEIVSLVNLRRLGGDGEVEGGYNSWMEFKN